MTLLALSIPRAAVAQAVRSAEVSGGYAYVQDPRIDLSLPVGWMLGAAANVNGWLSAVVDIGASRKTVPTIVDDLHFSVRSIMFGARVSTPIGPFTEFGQALIGIVNARGTTFGVTTSTTHVGAQFGGGLDYPRQKKLAVRGELDVRLIRGDGSGGPTERQYRAVAAVVYKLF